MHLQTFGGSLQTFLIASKEGRNEGKEAEEREKGNVGERERMGERGQDSTV